MRQFVSEEFPKNGVISVTGKNFRYFRQVLRFKAGDMVKVRLPDGTLLDTTLCKIDEAKKEIILQECGTSEIQMPQNENPSSTIILFQFIPKSSKMDLIVRQATECGVSKIVPVKSDFSQKFEKDYRSDRLSRIIKEARQQSGSPVSTSVTDAVSVDDAIKLWKENSDNKNKVGLVLYERGENTVSMVEALANVDKENLELTLAVGGEGGISPDEIKKFSENGFRIVHFETNILRCETAALYAVASAQVLITEKEKWLLKE